MFKPSQLKKQFLRIAMSMATVMLILLLEIASSNCNMQGEFSFNGYGVEVDGEAELGSGGLIKLTTAPCLQRFGQAFYNIPLQFKNSTDGSAYSFSTTFIFAIVPQYPTRGGHGIAFAISPSKGIPGALPSKYLGLFNETSNGNNSSHVVAVELDTIESSEFDDINNNHVGININGLKSVVSASAGYYSDGDGRFKELKLISAERMRVWVEYDGFHKQLNVTLHPLNVQKPHSPLLSLKKDLSPFINKFMYAGFSSSCGSVSASQYILGWSFKMNGQAQEIDLSRLPRAPGVADGKGGYGKTRNMLAVVLSLTGAALLFILIFGAILISRRRKFNEVLEDWEMLYGPHSFTYKDLFVATKGFKDKQLLGKGGFGSVFRGILPSSNVEIAVKKISHDSRQGMREFVAEIATIGRLRHPNLVRLLGYCRRKGELFLVYDYIPNGSLDKYLYGQPDCILNWTQRFKIIKDVASALFYLHQQWVQVIIHRDIKPANVLIDNEMNARLGDFGLAKLCDHGNDPQTSNIAGTLGYMAPELARSGKANTGTDMYAFGVFMLEVACGRRPVDGQVPPDQVVLIDWVMDCWDRAEILEAVDGRIGNEYVVHEVELVLKLGLLCSHPVAAARPDMSDVMQFLDGANEFPDNLNAIMKSRDFGDGSKEGSSVPLIEIPEEKTSIPPITLSESFASRGR